MPETTDTVGKMLADLAETPAAITRLANRAYAHRLFPEYAEATYPSLPRSAGPSASSQPPTRS